MTQPLHLEILPEEQRRLFERFAEQDWINTYYLAGGTSLALLMGHRQSNDFDFFIQKDFSNEDILGRVRRLGSFELFDESENTVNGSLDRVRISFLKFEYPLLKGTFEYKNLRIADIFDVALMKLAAISGRGSRKDFIDLYFLTEIFKFSELFEGYGRKFGVETANQYHLLKSLIYFEDAEKQPMPKMIRSVEWGEVKKAIVQKVKQVKF